MRYTNYLAGKVNESGVPNLSASGFKNYMNVVFLEGKIEALKSAKDKNKFSMRIFKLQKSVTIITGNLKPEDFIKMQVEGYWD